MNLNKLVEAAIYSAVRRAGWRYRPEITREHMLAELEVLLQGPAQAELAPELIAALERGRRMLAEGRAGDLLSAEAPDVFVCRTCGHAELDSPPDRCPDCGSWPGRFSWKRSVPSSTVMPSWSWVSAARRKDTMRGIS
jgi:rubrerythrin